VRDELLTAKDGTLYSFNNIRTQGWLNGHTSGLAEAVNWLKEQAVARFREGKDDAAKDLRRLAENMEHELRPGMEQRAKRHEREHPAIVETEAAE